MQKVMKKSIYAICGTLLLLTGCDNFLGGDLIKEQIDNQVEYLNANPVTVRVLGEKDAVKFISGNGDSTLKPSDTKSIEFKLNTEKYTFTGWKVTSKDDESKDCSSRVNLAVTNSDDVYKTDLKLLSGGTDIVITAICRLKPMVNSAEPAYYPSGVSVYRPVKFNFSQAVNPADVSDFTNIEITNKKNEPLEGLFEAPVLSEDGKTLILNPIVSELKKLVSVAPTFDINVKVTSAIREAETGANLREYVHAYRISNVKDQGKPNIKKEDFAIFRNVKDFSTGVVGPQQINDKGYSEWTYGWDDVNEYFNQKDFLEHRVGNYIIFNAKGTDDVSGIKCLQIREETVTPNGGIVSTGTSASFTQTGEQEYSLKNCTYGLKSSDGVIKLEICAVDYEGNISDPITYYVVKDTTFNNQMLKLTFNSTGISDYRVLQSDKKDHYAAINGFKAYDKYLELDFYSFTSEMDVRITYWDEGETEEKEIYRISNYASGWQDHIHNVDCSAFYNCQGYSLYGTPEFKEIVRDPSKNTYVKITAENDIGEYAEKVYTIPATEKSIISWTAYDASKNALIYLTLPEEGKYENYRYFACKDNVLTELEVNKTNGSELGKIKNYTFAPDNEYSLYFETKNSDDIKSCLALPVNFEVNKNGAVVSKLKGTASPKSWPVIEKIQCVSAGVNTGVHNVKITYSDMGDPDYIFNFYYVDGSSMITLPLLEEFTIPSGKEYQLGLEWYDLNGYKMNHKTFESNDLYNKQEYKNANEIIYESTIAKTETDNYKVVLPATYDNIPPVNVDYGFYIEGGIYQTESAPNELLITSQINSGIQDAGDAGLEETGIRKGIKNVVHYWIVKNTSENELVPYSEELLQTLQENKYSATNLFNKTNGYSTTIPYDFTENGHYTLFYKVFDKNKNFYLGKSFVGYDVEGELDPAKITVPAAGKLKLSEVSDVMNNQNTKVWNLLADNTWYYKAVGRQIDLSGSGNKNSEDCFIKISLENKGASFRDRELGPVTFSRSYKTLYIHPKYFTDPENFVIKRKNVISFDSGEQIYTNQPTLVRTVYSATNWGDDAALWGTRGLEADINVVKDDTFYSANIEDVPDNKYYCVLVNFADGTCCMSDVKKKGE